MMCFQDSGIDSGFRGFSQRTDKRFAPRWLLVVGECFMWLAIAAGISALIYALFILPGCKSFNPFGWLPDDDSTEYERGVDTSTLDLMALTLLIPGVAILVLGCLPFFSMLTPLRKMGWTLVGIGFAAAVTSALVEEYANLIMYTGFGFIAVVAGMWIWGHRKKIAQGKLSEVIS